MSVMVAVDLTVKVVAVGEVEMRVVLHVVVANKNSTRLLDNFIAR